MSPRAASRTRCCSLRRPTKDGLYGNSRGAAARHEPGQGVRASPHAASLRLTYAGPVFCGVSDDNLIEQINEQLVRLRATTSAVGALAAVHVEDRGSGEAVLWGSARSGFYWLGSQCEILERLAALPNVSEGGSGPEMIRSEFA